MRDSAAPGDLRRHLQGDAYTHTHVLTPEPQWMKGLVSVTAAECSGSGPAEPGWGSCSSSL